MIAMHETLKGSSLTGGIGATGDPQILRLAMKET